MNRSGKKRPARALLRAGAGLVVGLTLSGCPCQNCFQWDLTYQPSDLSAPDLAEEPDAGPPPDGGLGKGGR